MSFRVQKALNLGEGPTSFITKNHKLSMDIAFTCMLWERESLGIFSLKSTCCNETIREKEIFRQDREMYEHYMYRSIRTVVM